MSASSSERRPSLIPGSEGFNLKLSQKSAYFHVSSTKLVPIENNHNKNKNDFKSKVDDIHHKKSIIRQNFRDKFDITSSSSSSSSGSNDLMISYSREKSNDIAKILLANSSFSKTYLKMNDALHKKSSSSWGSSSSSSSIFYEEHHRAEFPKRNHICWNTGMTKHIDLVEDVIIDHPEKSDDISIRDNHDNHQDIIRSSFSDGHALHPIPDDIKAKYFGRAAKQHFYDTYHEIDHMSHLVVGGLQGVEHIISQEKKHHHDGHHISSSPSSLTADHHNVSQKNSMILAPLEMINGHHPPASSSSSSSSAITWAEPISSSSPSLSTSTTALSLKHPLSIPASATITPMITPKHHHVLSSPSSPSDDQLFNFTEDDMHNIYRTSYNSNSPRATFLIGCLRHNLPPRALAMIRNRLTTTLDLSHLGLGDELITLLSQSLAYLPALEVIILKDNNLLDHGLEVIIDSISSHDGILELDLSYNKIGMRAARALGKMIASNGCKLIGLCVSADNVEDSVCALFVDCLMNNQVLRELDLSNNLLGKDEQLTAFSPTITSGQSLANLLRQGRCPLQKLNVHWNMIRLSGAAELCDSLRYTDRLVHLNLSYNGIGRHAATVLGSALLENTVLEELVISNNSIDAIGCFTIVVGAREHPALKFIDLDGNPIGEQGARMLMKLAKYHGWRIKFTAFRCDAMIQSKDVIFKTNEPIGKYELNLSIPYHRAVACEIMDVVALDPTLGFKYFDIKEQGSKTYRAAKLVKFRQAVKPSNDITAHDLNLLRTIAEIAKDSDQIARVFKLFDEDESGELDADEFRHLIQKLGLDASEEKVKAVLATLDADGESLINLDETKDYIWNVGRAAKAQIREIETYPSVSAIEASPYRKYNLPLAGTIKVEISESLKNIEESGCFTKQQCRWVMDAADKSNNPALLLQYAMDLSSLYLDEAQTLFKGLQVYEDVNAVILSKIIPRMASTMDATSLVKIYFGNHIKQNRNLKKVLGMAYHPLLGMYNGYYSLDLIREHDRICLHKLFAQSIKVNAIRQGKKLADVSQYGTWSCFRNIRRDGKIIAVLQPELFSPMPKFGILEFDFMDISRPVYEVDKPIPEFKLFQLLRSCGLVRTQAQVRLVKNRLRDGIPKQRFALGDTRSPSTSWSPDTGRMVSVFEHLQRMYRSIDHRFTSYEKSFRKEVFTERGVSIECVDEIIADDEVMIIDDNKDDDDDDSVTHTGASTIIPALEASSPLERRSSHLSIYRRPTEFRDLRISTSPSAKLPSSSSSSSSPTKSPSRSSSVLLSPNKIPRSLDRFPSFYKKTGGSDSPVSLLRASMNKSSLSSSSSSNMMRKRATVDLSNTSPVGHHINIKGSGINHHTQSFHISIDEMNFPAMPKIAVISEAETARFDKILCDPHAPAEFKSSLLLYFMTTHFAARYFTVAQLSVIMELFAIGMVAKTAYGSYRVELLVFLYGRIIDLHNINTVLRVLTAEEHAALLFRVGLLNMFNPMKPEGVYRLDLSRWEERQVAKMLIHLSIAEPGTNWQEESYTFANQTDAMPGWTLTVIWYTEQGLPKQGILQLRMFSGGGMAINDCKPDVSLRRMLLHHVLIDYASMCLDLSSISSSSSSSSSMDKMMNHQQGYRDIIYQQLHMHPDVHDRYSLQDSIQHLATKTPIKWTYFGPNMMNDSSRPASRPATAQPPRAKNKASDK